MKSPKRWGSTVFLSALGATLSLFAATLALQAAPATAAPNGHSVAVAPTQELAILLVAQTAHSAPDTHAAALELVSAQRPITDERTVLPVIGHRSTKGVAWLHVLLPGRPNGHEGWIKRAGTSATRTSWHLVVDTSERRVTVYQDGLLVRTFQAVVGKPSTPTPIGQFFVEETVQVAANAVGAPFALALSARSNVLQEFDGGPGQIALHGLSNVGGVPGTAVSHGCVRLSDDTMRWLAARIGPGFPVTIVR
jgi:lipoprotein-anchoring transpeptidase ErfK/SrfK